jgi:hypothetical protein
MTFCVGSLAKAFDNFAASILGLGNGLSGHLFTHSRNEFVVYWRPARQREVAKPN